MRWGAWICALFLLGVARPARAETAAGFHNHVIAVRLPTKAEQADTPELADFYIDMGRADGAKPGMQFWAYRLEDYATGEGGDSRTVAIPVARLEAFHVDERVSIARITDLALPADEALVKYRTVMLHDAVEPIAGTGVVPPGEGDLPAEVVTVDPGLLPPLGAKERVLRTYSIPNVVLFDFDKSVLRPEGKAILDQVIAFIRGQQVSSVRVEGHTDAIGTLQYNVGLSQRRAKSVREYLVRHGHVQSDLIVSLGFGETKPVASNATPEGRQRNRRTEVLVNGRPPGRQEPDGMAVGPEAVIPEDQAQPDRTPEAPPAPEAAEPPTPPEPPAGPAPAAEAPGPALPELAHPPRGS